MALVLIVMMAAIIGLTALVGLFQLLFAPDQHPRIVFQSHEPIRGSQLFLFGWLAIVMATFFTRIAVMKLEMILLKIIDRLEFQGATHD